MKKETMPIDQRSKSESEKPKPLVFRDNPEVKKKIEAYKEANPNDAAYYTRLVKEHPERAIDTLVYKDVQKHESEMRLIQKQLPQARAFYEAQPADVKKRIDEALKETPAYFQDKAFVNEVLREKDRQARRELANPAPAAKPGARVAA
jgi:hypothetical protein